MSAFGGRADSLACLAGCPLIAISGPLDEREKSEIFQTDISRMPLNRKALCPAFPMTGGTPPGGAPGAARRAVQCDSSIGNLLRPMCNTSTARVISTIVPPITRMRRSGMALSSITSRRVSAVMAT